MVMVLAAPVAASDWVISGPAGGEAREVVTHPSLGARVYALTWHGVAASDDGGQTWRRTHPQRWYGLRDLVVDETHGALFVIAPPASGTPGLCRSLDGGVTWALVRADDRGDLRGVRPYESDAGSGVRMWTYHTLDASLDGGTSWERLVEDAQAELGVHIGDVEPVRGGGGTLYVEGGGPIDPTVVASRDGGRTWSTPTRFPGRVYRLAAGVGPDAPVFASLWLGELLRSIDWGRTWVAVSPPVGGGGITLLEVSPHRPFELWAAVQDHGLFRSEDGGQSWQQIDQVAANETVAAVAIAAGDADVVYLGGSLRPDGGRRSSDNGASWQAATAGLPPTRVRALAVDPAHPDIVYATADLLWGGLGGLWLSRDRGRSWQLQPDSDELGDAVAVDPLDPTHLYAGSLSGLHRSFDGGESWHADSSNLSGLRVTSVSPDPQRPGTLLVTAMSPYGYSLGYRTVDGGASWEALPIGDAYAMARDPGQAAVVYCLGWMRLWKSIDHGESWSTVYANQSGWYLKMTAVAAEPGHPGRLLLGQDIGLRASEDGGTTWQVHDDGLDIECHSGSWPKQSQPILCNGPSAVVWNPGGGGQAFVATGLLDENPDAGTGVYVSTADGNGWRSLAPHPDVTGGVDLEISPDGRTLYLAVAHGGVAVLELGEPRQAGGRLR